MEALERRGEGQATIAVGVPGARRDLVTRRAEASAGTPSVVTDRDNGGCVGT